MKVAGHDVHDVPSKNVLAGHVHCPMPMAPEAVAVAGQAVHDKLPTSRKESLGQTHCSICVDPTRAVALGGHDAQLPLSKNLSAGHRQCVMSVDPTEESAPVGHATQVKFVSAPLSR